MPFFLEWRYIIKKGLGFALKYLELFTIVPTRRLLLNFTKDIRDFFPLRILQIGPSLPVLWSPFKDGSEFEAYNEQFVSSGSETDKIIDLANAIELFKVRILSWTVRDRSFGK